LIRSDFDLFVDELVRRHPGLLFLENTKEFQFKYSQTVIGRIFYSVNKSGTERLTLKELKNSNLLEMMSLLDGEDDINKINDYFSYEHFYVIYCKYWELDSDHDGFINGEDLQRYEEYSLTQTIVKRIVEGKGRKLLCKEGEGVMNYLDFLVFLISEVDKSSDVSIDYWFNACDGDCDGLLSPFEIEEIFKEQRVRIQALSQEQILWEDILCQLIDGILIPHSSEEGGERREERRALDKPLLSRSPTDLYSNSLFTKKALKSSGLAPVFFNTLFNLNQYLLSEQRDPVRMKHIHDTPQLSDWDRYAIEHYYKLAEMEQMEQEQQALREDNLYLTGGEEERNRGGEGDEEEGIPLNEFQRRLNWVL